MFFSVITYIFLTTDSKQVPSNNLCLSSLHCYASYISRNHGKEILGNFKNLLSRFGGSEKDQYLLKIMKWQHKLVRDYKWRILVSYFLNNAAKQEKFQRTLKLSMSFSLKHFFISVAISTQVASPLSRFKLTFQSREKLSMLRATTVKPEGQNILKLSML